LNPELCSEIANEKSKERCFSEVAIGKEDKSVCNDLTGDSRDKCFLSYAKFSGKLEDCDDVNQPELQDGCRIFMARRLKNPEICADTTITLRDMCYAEAAKAVLEEKWCNQVDNEKKGNKCFSDVAIAKDSPKACDGIKGDSFKRDECVMKVARAAKRADDCDLITESKDVHIKCITQVAIARKSEATCNKLGIDTPEYKSCRMQVPYSG
jgi:hypothetical protein